MKNERSLEQGIIPSGQSLEERVYWVNKFSEEFEKCCFHYDYPVTTSSSDQLAVDQLKMKFPHQLFARTVKLSGESDTKLFMILVSGLMVLLQKYTGSKDIIVGTPIYKQDIEGEFINTVIPMRNQVHTHLTFKELLLEVRKTIIDGYKNQNYPMNALLQELNIPLTGKRFPLFDIAIFLENIHDKRYISHTNPSMYFGFHKTELEIELVLEYGSLFYEKQTVERIGTHFMNLLHQALANVDLPLSQIRLLSGEEMQQVLVTFNRTPAESAANITAKVKNKTIPQLLEEQVRKTPDNPAVLVCNGIEKNEITYRQLNKSVLRLAHVLKQKGVKHDTIVGVMLKPSIEMIVGILGVLKAGAAYLPIDTASPPQRIHATLLDSAAQFLISKKQWMEKINFSKTVIDLDDEIYHPAPLPPEAEGDAVNTSTNLAYVIYTSGSTGVPKGVLIEHRNLLNYVYWRLTAYRQTSQDVCLQLLSIAFDGFCANVYPTLLSGGKLVLISENHLLDIPYIGKIIKEEKVTTFSLTPLWYKSILEGVKKEDLQDVRFAVIGGDFIRSDTLEMSQRQAPHIRLINEYGPTENSVTTTAHIGMTSENASVVGQPIANNYILILDENQFPRPIGAPGELCVYGEGLTRGYLNHPDLTAEKFIQLEAAGGLSPLSTSGYHKLYRTGDIARWLPDGSANIELVGRVDDQLKIRGYRIELGEIEACLLSHHYIKEVIVIVVGGEIPGGGTADAPDKVLYAFYVLNDPKTILSAGEIKEYLLMNLPDYMIPSYFLQLEAIPYTPTAKIDRKKLLTLAENMKDKTGSSELRSETEKKLAEIWKEVLQIEQVGQKDNFFNIGGDSIKILSLLNTINKKFGTGFTVEALYENDTIEQMAALVNKNRGASLGEEYNEITTRLEELKARIMERIDQTDNIEDIYPMSDIEKGMIYHSLRNDYSYVFQKQLVFYKRDREFIFDFFKQAMVLMIQKHPILRTVFNMDDFEEPVQIVLKEIAPEIDFHDISSMEKNEQEKYIIPILLEDRQNSFTFSGKEPLWRLKLFKLDKENICLVWHGHHAILDGWSSTSLMTEMNNTYIRLKTGPGFVPQPLKSTYKEFIIEQLYQKEQEDIKAFWRKELEGYNRIKIWGTHHPFEAVGKKKMYHTNLEISLLEKLKETANTYDITLRNMCFAAYAYLLNLTSFENDITLGFVINNRPACEDGDKIIGCFLNTLPVRIKIPADLTWKDYMKLVDKKLQQLAKYNRYSLFEISASLGESVQKENPIVDTIFIFTDYFILKQLDQEETDKEQDGTDKEILAEIREKLEIEEEGVSNTLLDLSIDTTFENFRLTLSYPESMEDHMIHWMASSYEKILKNFTGEPDIVVNRDEFIPAKQKQKLLYHFNNTTCQYPQDKTLHRLFAEQVSRKADGTAMVLSTGHLTYGGLNEHSHRLSGILREKGIRANCIVGLIMRNSLAMAVGILGVLKSGGAYLPIDPEYPYGRKTYVIDDSKIKTLVVDYPPADREIETSGLSSVSIIGINDENLPAPGKPVESPDTTAGPGDTAYVIYTSGTTGKPRGVLIPHKGVANYTSWRIKTYGYTERDVTLQLLPYYFDGFVSNFYSSLLSGGTLVMVPDSRKRDYDYINEIIPRRCVTNMSLVPGMYEALLNVAAVGGYSLKSMRFVILAGERSSKTLLEKSIRQHPSLVHINEYGPTEISVTAVANTTMIDDSTHIIGTPIANTRIYILDTLLKMVPPGTPGELCIEGVGLAKGYLNHPELSGEKFVKSPYNEKRQLYRSGDVARWRENGTLEYLGRLDHQVKIRGFRIEIEEIEYQLLRYNQVKEVAVIAREADTEKEHATGMENIFLCAYVISDEIIDIAPLKEFLSQQLPEYMIPTHIVQVEAIPLTPNGKVDRKILPDPDFEMKFAAPQDETGKKLAEIWAEVLKIEKSDISIDHNFFQLGGHSLRATVLAVKIQKEFNVELTVEDIFTLTTIRQLSEYIKKEAGKKKFLSIEAVEKKEYYPLSSAQKRLFFIQQMLPDSIAYNLTQVLVLKGRFEKKRWERAFTKLIERHESLRTSLEMINGDPAQKIKKMDEQEFEIEYFDVETGEEKVIKNFVRPFDLSVPSLLRVGLVNAGKTNPVMIVDMHHIISDGVSHGSLIRDFFTLYNGKQPPPLRLQYKDYAQWQDSDKQDEALMKQEEYWLKRLEGEIPALDMFTDYPRPAHENFEADHISFELEKELTRDLNEMVKETGTTLFILLLAVYNILLSKYSGQEDIIVGSTIAGRNHADLEHLIGIFVNLLAMRNRAGEDKRFIDFLKEVKTNTIDAFENQDYPFDKLVKKLGLERNWKRNPLFDTQFILQNLESEREDIETSGLTFEPYNYKKTRTPFDLFLEATETDATISMRLIYLTSLYKHSTVECMSKHYIEILRQVVENREIPLKDIQISHALSAAQSLVTQKEVMAFEL